MDERETCQVLYVAQCSLVKETFKIKVYTTVFWKNYEINMGFDLTDRR
jgi:hypothetical protein